MNLWQISKADWRRILIGIASATLLAFSFVRINSPYSLPLFVGVFLAASPVFFIDKANLKPSTRYFALSIIFTSWLIQRVKEHGLFGVPTFFMALSSVFFLILACWELVVEGRQRLST